MIVMDQYSRRIIGMAVHCGLLNGPAICNMFSRIISGTKMPKYLCMDNDPLFRFSQWKRNLRILEIESIHSVPYVPWSHPYVESLIGRVRFELTDRVLFRNADSLERKLDRYIQYYNENRVHSSLGGRPPLEFLGKKVNTKATLQNYKWSKVCRGMFHVPSAA